MCASNDKNGDPVTCSSGLGTREYSGGFEWSMSKMKVTDVYLDVYFLDQEGSMVVDELGQTRLVLEVYSIDVRKMVVQV